MGAILLLASKDVRRRLASPAGLILNLAIPIAIAGTMALAFGGRGGDEPPRLRMILADLDDTPLSGVIAGSGQNPEASKHMAVLAVRSREEGLRAMREQGHSAMLVIPRGFSEALLDGGPAELELVKNPSERIMPVAAQQMAEVLALYLSVGVRVVGDEGPRLRRLLEGEGWDESAALAGFVTTLSERARGLRGLLLPPVVELRQRRPEGAERARAFDMIGWMYPGVLVMGLLFTALAQMKDLLEEKSSGTLRRVLTAPVGARQVLLGKVVSVAAVVALAHLILLAAGSLAFGVRWGRLDLLAAASAAVVLAATGFAALVLSLSRTERQGDAFGGILIMVMSLLGGTFVPPQLMPDWLAGLSRLTLNYWGQGALRGLTAGAGWASVGPKLAVLAAIAALTVGLGTVLLKARHVRAAA